MIKHPRQPVPAKALASIISQYDEVKERHPESVETIETVLAYNNSGRDNDTANTFNAVGRRLVLLERRIADLEKRAVSFGAKN